MHAYKLNLPVEESDLEELDREVRELAEDISSNQPWNRDYLERVRRYIKLRRIQASIGRGELN